LILFCAALNATAACLTLPMMQGQDPAVVYHDGYFHLVQSDGCNIRLRRASTLSELAAAPNVVIHSPGCSELWAPEIHWISNRWYLYYTLNANPGTGGLDRRGYVAESEGADPYGPYIDRGILFNGYWNIDGSVFAWSNRLYYVFSGEPVPGQQKICIAPMLNPWTLSGAPVVISTPTESWETVGHPDVNEGPWGFQRDGRLFIVYSASGCWTDDYALGLLTLTGPDLLSPASWTKSGPVFSQKPGAYGPGHNSLVVDPFGQWWNVYHANSNPGEGCANQRQIRAQRLFWNSNGMPDFGSPVPYGSVVTEDPDFLVAHFPLTETNGSVAASTVCGRTGTILGARLWANPGLIFNGTNTHVDCGRALGNDVQHTLTLAAWVRPDSFRDWAGILTKGVNVSPYAMQIWGNGALRFTANWGMPAGGIGEGSWNSKMRLSLGQWTHVAVTYDGDRVRFYLNGRLDSNQPQAALRFGVTNEPLVIGADLPGGDEFFHGIIRDARVYGRALSQEEIQLLLNQPPTPGAIPDVFMVAGQTLVLTNTASDPDVPPQTLTFTLIDGPEGAAVDPVTGVLTWASTLAHANTTNLVTVRVTDDGTPSLSGTTTFNIFVRSPVTPVLSRPVVNAGSLVFAVEGDPGLTYAIRSSTNLVDWSTHSVTNPPEIPFSVSLPGPPGDPHTFYRVEIGN